MSITLAIESAIAGGSISLLSGRELIAEWTGTASVSKAEDLLPNIDELLRNNKIDLGEIELIAVSAGPGSFTGIRIGIATALGLKAGLGIPMVSQSSLSAVAAAFEDETVMVGLPAGRNAVAVQKFGRESADEPSAISLEDLEELKRPPSDATLILHQSLITGDSAPNIINAGNNIARYIGLACIARPGIVAEPLFISKPF